MSETIDVAAPPATACYVYGVVPSDTAPPQGHEGIGEPAGEVVLVQHGAIAALISEIDQTRPLGTRGDLLAHERLLDAIAQHSPTLPMKFGAVLSDADAVVEELLAAHHDHLAGVLAELEGHVQYTLKSRYAEQAALAEVVSEEPEVANLRERTRQVPHDAGYYDRIRLGELIVQALARKREVDTEVLVDALASHATAVSVHEPGDELDMANVAFLVHREHDAAFEAAVDDLARTWGERARLRLLGPLAPYDFVEPGQDRPWD